MTVRTFDDKKELWDRFGQRFLVSTRERLTRAREMLDAGLTDAHRFAREMHALAGEAAVLGIDDVKELAQKSSEAAALAPTIDEKIVGSCDAAVREIHTIIDSL